MSEHILTYIISGIAGIALFFLKGILSEIKSLRSDINATMIVQNGLKIELEVIKEEVKEIKTNCKYYHKGV